jgi:hypothetical protein
MVILLYRGEGRLRRGAHGTVLLGKVRLGHVWCIGEGIQEGNALMPCQNEAAAWLWLD